MKEKIAKISGLVADFSILAIIFFIPIFFSWFFWSSEVFEINKIALFRILLVFGSLAFLANMLSAGKIILPDKKCPLFIFAFTIVFFGFISAWGAESHSLSFWGQNDRGQGFLSLLSYIIFFSLLIFRLKTFGQIKMILSVIVASSFVVCLYGILQFFGLDYISWEEPAKETGRIFSSFGQPNFLGHYLVLVIPLLVYSLFFQVRSFWGRTALLIILAIEIFCLAVTYSRAAWLAFAISGVSAFLGITWLLGHKKVAKVLGLLTGVGVALVIIFFIFGFIREVRVDDPPLLKRALSVFEVGNGSVGARLNYWQAGFIEIKSLSPKRLLFGYGPDSLRDVFSKRYEPSWAVNEKLRPDRAHNLFFDVILQFGLLGISIWIFFIAYVAGRIIIFFRMKKSGTDRWLAFAILISLFAYFINNLFSFSATTHFVYFYLFLAILFFVVDFAIDKDKPLGKTIVIRWPWQLLLFVFCLLAFLFGTIIYYNIRLVLADVYYARSRSVIGQDCFSSLDDLFMAVYLNPYSIYYKGRLLSGSAGCLERLPEGKEREQLFRQLDLLLKNFSRERGDLSFRLDQAAAKSVLGFNGYQSHEKEAREEFLLLEKEYPNINSTYRYHTYSEMRLGNYDQAIVVASEGLQRTTPLSWFSEESKHWEAVKRETIGFYEELGFSFYRLGKINEAVLYYEKIIELDPEYLSAYNSLSLIFAEGGNEEQAQYYQDKKKEYE